MRVDLVTKQQKLAIAEKKAAELKKRLERATARLDAQKKEKEAKKKSEAVKKSGAKKKSNAKRKLPQPTTTAAASESPSPAKKGKTKVSPFSDIMGPKNSGTPTDSESDDEVPIPDGANATSPQPAKDKAYEGLHSTLCAYKAGVIDPRNSKDITFEICAEMIEDEIEETRRWQRPEKVKYHAMIISALKLTYKEKDPQWFFQPFLLSPTGTHKYWIKVMQKRADLWRAAAKKEAQPSRAPRTVQQRLQKKLAKKKLVQAKNAEKAAQPTTSKAKPAVMVISDSSDSDSAAEAASAKPAKSAAPAPDQYTPMEIKAFSNMAKAIRNADDSSGISAAVADFVDAEFSDNTYVITAHRLPRPHTTIQPHRGKMARARKAPYGSWKHSQFKLACTKAARIMDDRYPQTHNNVSTDN